LAKEHRDTVRAATAGTGARKRRSPAEIRERLVRAAREEFRRSGFAGATTAGIARAADVTEMQLFRCFGSKAELFREAVFEPLNEHFAAFNARHLSDLAGLSSIHEQARLYITELQEFLDEHSKLLLSLIVAQTFTSGSLQGVGEIGSLRAYFERGAAMMSSRVEPDPQVDPALLVRVSFAAVLGCVMFRDWIFPVGLASHEAIDAAIVDFVIDGISVNSDPGLRAADSKDKRRRT